MRGDFCRALTAFAALALGAGAAHAECKLARLADLPVTMSGMRPLVEAKINGVSGQFIADSGAFYSLISPGMAGAARVELEAMPGYRITAVGGTVAPSLTTVKELILAGYPIHNHQFLVGGSDTGLAGALGQDVLGVGDVEYDLPDGHIRLYRSQDCSNTILAPGSKPGETWLELKIDKLSRSDMHTSATIIVNGVALHAVFDTGAPWTTLSTRAAARLGIKPDGPGVESKGSIGGIGQGMVQVWSVPVATIKIGDEEIHNARIMMQALTNLDTDMLIGADFFISHRVYVDNSSHRMFFSYTGGELFHHKTRGDAASAAATAATGDEPKDAEGFSRRGAVFVAQHDLTPALADFSRAIELAPKDPRYLVQRAQAHLQDHQPMLAKVDFDKAIALDPADVPALLGRAQLRIGRGERKDAIANLDAAARALAPSDNDRLFIGQLYDGADAFGAAIGEYDLWIRAHPEDSALPTALNDRCWARALAGDDLPRALGDCNRALGLRPHTANFLDSRGLVRLRMGNWDKAIADYDEALKLQPRLAWSLYGRGLARRHKGLAKDGDADIAAAIAIEPKLPERAKALGIN